MSEFTKLEVHLWPDESIWEDIKDGSPEARLYDLNSIMRCPGATQKGNSIVVMRIDGPNGPILAATTMKLFLTAAKAFETKESEK